MVYLVMLEMEQQSAVILLSQTCLETYRESSTWLFRVIPSNRASRRSTIGRRRKRMLSARGGRSP